MTSSLLCSMYLAHLETHLLLPAMPPSRGNAGLLLLQPQGPQQVKKQLLKPALKRERLSVSDQTKLSD